MRSASLKVASAGQIANASAFAVFNGLIVINGGGHQIPWHGLPATLAYPHFVGERVRTFDTWRLGWRRYNPRALMNAAAKTKDPTAMSRGTLLPHGHKSSAHTPRLQPRSSRRLTPGKRGDISHFTQWSQEP